MVSIIFATGIPYADGRLPIGKNGNLPWYHKADMKWFRKTTVGHTVIMGKRTFDSLGCKPLPNRRNIVVSTALMGADGVEVFSTLESAIDTVRKERDDEIFIIGGATLYKYALDHQIVDKIYVDFLDIVVDEADTFFPLTRGYFDSDTLVKKTHERLDNDANAYSYEIMYGLNHNDVDEKYISLVRQIMLTGTQKNTRSGEVLSTFGQFMKFNLKRGLPVLTTKKMFVKGCIHELLWFLKGDTNIKYLVDNNVHIWDDDAFRFAKKELSARPYSEKFKNMTKEEFLEHVKHRDYWGSYTFGDLGPVYGRQWTNWNTNQIENVINTLKTNPDDRRMIVSAWNVNAIDYMALPPCHYCFQFYSEEMDIDERCDIYREKNNIPRDIKIDLSNKELDERGIPQRKLSCMWIQRSVDVGLGLPFNILSYAILTHMIAQCVDMAPGNLIFSGGDTHIYMNQIEGLKEQCERNPFRYASPALVLNPDIKEISQFTFDDIKIEGYHSYPAIKLPLSTGL